MVAVDSNRFGAILADEDVTWPVGIAVPTGGVEVIPRQLERTHVKRTHVLHSLLDILQVSATVQKVSHRFHQHAVPQHSCSSHRGLVRGHVCLVDRAEYHRIVEERLPFVVRTSAGQLELVWVSGIEDNFVSDGGFDIALGEGGEGHAEPPSESSRSTTMRNL